MEKGVHRGKAVYCPGNLNWVLQTLTGFFHGGCWSLLTLLGHKGGNLPPLLSGVPAPIFHSSTLRKQSSKEEKKRRNKECKRLGTNFTFSAICKSQASLLSCSWP